MHKMFYTDIYQTITSLILEYIYIYIYINIYIYKYIYIYIHIYMCVCVCVCVCVCLKTSHKEKWFTCLFSSVDKCSENKETFFLLFYFIYLFSLLSQ